MSDEQQLASLADAVRNADPAAIARWKTYPSHTAKRVPCPHCGQPRTVPCDESNKDICGSYQAAKGPAPYHKRAG